MKTPRHFKGVKTIICRSVLPLLGAGAGILVQSAFALGQVEGVQETLNFEPAISGFLHQKVWSPYAAGIGIGILSWFAFLLSDHPLGVSTAYARSAGMIEEVFRGGKARQRPYYQKFPPKIDWEWMLVIGLFVGAALSAVTSGDFAWNFMPEVWIAEFGSGYSLRLVTAFAGGTIMGIGARWANGCTSGHALSGTMQLVASSWVAAIGIFGGGVITAFLMF